MNKGNLSEDPRGLLFEAYRMENISPPECRSIFLDWILGLDSSIEYELAMMAALKEYENDNFSHPMTQVIREGLSRSSAKGRKARKRKKQ
tara:strand:+ start:417 stop:686 length:270 start_codon:yes stop_codon:yes gene_type:complete